MGVEIVELTYRVNEDGGLGNLLRYGFMNKISRENVSDSRISPRVLTAFKTRSSEVKVGGSKYTLLRERVYDEGDELKMLVRYERIN